jgi:hypothetical protein
VYPSLNQSQGEIRGKETFDTLYFDTRYFDTRYFDTRYKEGAETPKMMNVALHRRIAGQPGRANGLDRFIAYAQSRPNVWFAGRAEIAGTWLQQLPPRRGP